MKKWITTVHRGLVGGALTMAGLAALGLGTFWLFKENTSAGLAGLGAGLILLFSATIDRFESIKGLGMEAKTRFDQKINEADRLLQQIRELAASTGSSLIDLHTSTAADGNPQERIAMTYDKVQEVRGVMLATGSDNSFIHTSSQNWAKATARDLWAHFATQVSEKVRSVNGQLTIEIMLDKNKKPLYKERIDAIEKFLTTEIKPQRNCEAIDYIKYLDILSSAPELDDQFRIALIKQIAKAKEELQYFSKNHEFRDREYWFNLPQL